MNERYLRMMGKLAALGQERALRFWPELDENSRRRLLDQLDHLDEEFLAAQRQRKWPLVAAGAGNLDGFTPQPYIPLPASREEEERRDRGKLKVEITARERALLMAALRETGGNQTRAAKLLGTTKRIVQYKVHKLGIDTRQFRPAPPPTPSPEET